MLNVTTNQCTDGYALRIQQMVPNSYPTCFITFWFSRGALPPGFPFAKSLTLGAFEPGVSLNWSPESEPDLRPWLGSAAGYLSRGVEQGGVALATQPPA